MTLDKLHVGQSGIIRSVGGEGALRLRLLDMGVIPKTHITVTRIAPMGDPVEVFLRGYTLSLRLEDAAKVEVAMSNAQRREKEAEATRIATAAEKIAAAQALEEAYAAEQKAEAARAAREKATAEADVIVKTEIEKRKKELEAEAEAEQIRRKAKGEADAIRLKMEAEASGAQAILLKQAEGLKEIVAAAGGDANDALRLMLADKMEELMRIQVDAVKNVKIDKVTVWDGGEGRDGKTATAGFVSGLMKTIPPMSEMFDMAGMNLPEFLGKKQEAAAPIPAPGEAPQNTSAEAEK